MEKRLSQTQTISDILNTFTFGQDSGGKSLSYSIKFSTITNFWEDIVGKKLAKYTKPTKIKYSKMYITAKNPTIIQEILFNRQKILSKLNSYSQALSIEIKDLVLDYKNFEKETKEIILPQDEKSEFYSEKTLNNIELESKLQENIKKSVDKITFLDERKKSELLNKLLNLKKAQIKRENSGQK